MVMTIEDNEIFMYSSHHTSHQQSKSCMRLILHCALATKASCVPSSWLAHNARSVSYMTLTVDMRQYDGHAADHVRPGLSLRFCNCILPAIKNWRCRRPGNKAMCNPLFERWDNYNRPSLNPFIFSEKPFAFLFGSFLEHMNS